jgi:DNA-directed RNA polymerase subunit M/transcription elongation factor TFIIS
MDPRRESVIDLLKQKTDLNGEDVSNIEVGIYNWTLARCDEKKIVKNWKNPRFANIYGEKARSVISNLDSTSYIGNTRLATRLKEKEFQPHELSEMKPENLFPERWREAVENYINKTEHSYERSDMTMTDLFKCGKCKNRKVSYIEKQVRSADEATSIFCICTVCGHRWRIG